VLVGAGVGVGAGLLPAESEEPPPQEDKSRLTKPTNKDVVIELNGIFDMVSNKKVKKIKNLWADIQNFTLSK
jgi:hypothetical protein